MRHPVSRTTTNGQNNNIARRNGKLGTNHDGPDQQRRRRQRRLRVGRDPVLGVRPRLPTALRHRRIGRGLQAWLPDGYSQNFRSYVFGTSGFWTMAPLRYAAKFDPFLFLDCARVEGGIKFCHLDFRSERFQSRVRRCVMMLEDATRLVSLADIFSRNRPRPLYLGFLILHL